MGYKFIFSVLILLMNKFPESNCNEFNFTVNPDCLDCDDKPWLIYGRKENGSHLIHYLWSAVEIPSFIIAASSPDSELVINWQDFKEGMPGAIQFSDTPQDIFGISFQTLILFDDKEDTGVLDNIPEEDKKYASLSEFEWTIDEYKNKSDDFVVSFSTTSFRQNTLPNDTKISISVTAFGSEGRSDKLPHLSTMPDASHLEITLDNLILNMNNSYFEDDTNHHHHHHHARDDVAPISGFHHPRWALDAIIVTNDLPEEGKSNLEFTDKKSLDDEYTPGVFDLDSITSSSSYKGKGGYLQWRPVCYLTPDRDINYSTLPNINASLPAIDDEHLEKAKDSIFYSIFGDDLVNMTGVQTTIAFGFPKDEFYTKYNYTVWTFAMGLGSEPEEKFSSDIIIAICIGVALPSIVCIVGIAYLIGWRKRNRRTDGHERLRYTE